ncbi:MAG: enoyl-CoA hydratase/isomerase family protein [Deltaproteobacteria bacterium]|nr:enoyl-CoA hydratase/isomerase family protein [Deltaproteobacteria bacterium]
MNPIDRETQLQRAPHQDDFEHLVVGREEDLLWVRLDDPKRANALSQGMLTELTTLYSWPLRSVGIRALLLSGEGKNFSAGADLAHLRSLSNASHDENRQDSQRLRGLFESVLRQEVLTIALVHGACVAGGCGLATAHDYVVAEERSRFLYSEVKIGFVAALVATYLSLRLRGSHVRELLLNPRFIDAQEAVEIGLANRIAAPGELGEAGRDLAVEVLTNASSESIARTKALLLDLFGRSLDGAFGQAEEVNALARATDDCKHGVATFLETKKAPSWRS